MSTIHHDGRFWLETDEEKSTQVERDRQCEELRDWIIQDMRIGVIILLVTRLMERRQAIYRGGL